ncbi:hypothetical protein MLD38_034762 [Melastoma candidum]|uniref:Uncharacterized protein n=1 Tax=Melastoma candidum TaxID=119954 RepID=A0ACB9MAL0_9MYRT|nr:hypothetical protein MLD38_034762 [Melastoma candidum]
MEQEITLKITQTRADVTSIVDLRVANVKARVVFFSNETETAYILAAHLKGYQRDNINITINKDGSRIMIEGSMPVQDKLMHGWIMQKKEVELRGFQKVFRIPEGVILDKIKAKFREDTSTLTVFFPKSVKGMRRDGIKEVREREDDTKQETPEGDARDADAGLHTKHESAGKSEGGDQLDQAIKKELNTPQKQVKYKEDEQTESGSREWEKENENEEKKPDSMDQRPERIEEEKLQQGKPEFLASTICGEPHEFQNKGTLHVSKGTLQHENLEGSSSPSERIVASESMNATAHGKESRMDLTGKDEIHDQYQSSKSTESACTDNSTNRDVSKDNEAQKKRRSKCKLCNPAIAGSALLVSLIIIVVQLARNKHK